MTISRSCPTGSIGTCCKSPIDHSQVFYFLIFPRMFHLLTYVACVVIWVWYSQKQQGITGGMALELDGGYEILVNLFNLFKS